MGTSVSAVCRCICFGEEREQRTLLQMVSVLCRLTLRTYEDEHREKEAIGFRVLLVARSATQLLLGKREAVRNNLCHR